MSQRHSGYNPMLGDCYFTPAWVTEALFSVEEFPEPFWEPACGGLHMARVLEKYGDTAFSDIKYGPAGDFLSITNASKCCSIITNPPYSNDLAAKFVRHALKLTHPFAGKVAMLLPLTWDSAKGRRDLFQEYPEFSAKYILTERIRWENLEQKTAGPSQNHAWYVWDWKHSGPPILGWLP